MEVDAKDVVKVVYNNSLNMWRDRAMEFPYIARVSRRGLAIPAALAQSECMVSTARLTVSKRIGLLASENIESLVYLRCNWEAAEEQQR